MRTRKCVVLLLVVSSVASLARADEFEALKDEYRAADKKYWDAPDREKLTEPVRVFIPKFRALAERHAGSSVELRSLAFILTTSRRTPAAGPESDAQWAVRRLNERHAVNPAIGEVLPDLWFGFSSVGRQPMIDFYERIIKENKDKSVIAQAKLSLATTLRRVGSHGLREEKPYNRPDDVKRSTELFREIVAQNEGTDAAKRAARYLFEIEHLQAGMKAPDIVGKDVDGKPLRLSDFKGKIVYLDFWGFW